MSKTARLLQALFAILLILTVLNHYSNDPLFATIDTSGWSVPRLGVDDFEYLLGDKGYTFCASEDPAMLTSAKYIITQFRREWKSQLPISIAHCSEMTKSTMDELHRVHRDAVIQSFGSDVDALVSASFEIVDICDGDRISPGQKKRLRGWFCKTMALVNAPFRQTMLVDTDVIWLKNPDLLFQAPSYAATGALFFRDRLIFEMESPEPESGKKTSAMAGNGRTGKNDWLRFAEVREFIEKQALSLFGERINTSSPSFARKMMQGSAPHLGSSNFFWGPALNSTAPRLRHVQESSVVVLHRHKKPRTLQVLRQLIPSFRLGYGDKELYWIAATIAGESFSFEPFLAGVYGDCGEVLHYDPLAVGKSGINASAITMPVPFFINGQYISESVDFEGKGLQGLMSQPLFAAEDVHPFRPLGKRDPITGGNCGGCAAAGGCIRVPTDVSAAVVRQQQFQLKHVDPAFKTTFVGRIYYIARRVFAKFLPI